jgi:hypothetical protein
VIAPQARRIRGCHGKGVLTSYSRPYDAKNPVVRLTRRPANSFARPVSLCSGARAARAS